MGGLPGAARWGLWAPLGCGLAGALAQWGDRHTVIAMGPRNRGGLGEKRQETVSIRVSNFNAGLSRRGGGRLDNSPSDGGDAGEPLGKKAAAGPRFLGVARWCLFEKNAGGSRQIDKTPERGAEVDPRSLAGSGARTPAGYGFAEAASSAPTGASHPRNFGSVGVADRMSTAR